jgi:hypothetical protein
MPIPNVVQFTAGTPTVSSFKYMNFYLGVQDQGYGPTSITNFWNGISVPNGGYVYYLNKATDGPSIYVTENEESAFNLMKMIYPPPPPPINPPASFYNYLLTLWGPGIKSDGVIINRNYENIITDNLYISFDPSFYMCTVYSAGTPGTIKNMVLPELGLTTNNNINNSALKISDNGGVLSFDGATNGFVFFDFGSFNPHLRFSGDVTYEFFVRIKELTGATVPIYYKSPVHEGTLSADSTNKLVYSYGNGTNSQTFQSTTTLTNNTWYHIVLVRDLTGTQKLYWYINGSEDKNESATYSSAATSSESTTIFQNGSGGQEYTLADLGILRIYNSALTAAQVSQNFNAQKSRFGL